MSKMHTIILTHPIENGDYLSHRLSHDGINIVVDQMIETHPIALTPDQITEICHSDFIIFTSKRGVHYTISQINAMCCHDKKVVVVGPKTAQELKNCDVEPYLISTGQTGKEMCKTLLKKAQIKNKNVVAILAELADDTIENYLSNYCQFKRINVYQTTLQQSKSETTNKIINSDDPVLVTFTSPSAVQAFCNLYPNFNKSNVKCISIGPVTSNTIKMLNKEVAVESKQSTYESLYNSITEYLNINTLK